MKTRIKIKAAIIGASGYTGLELLRIIAGHPECEATDIASRKNAGKSASELFPSLKGTYDKLVFKTPDEIADTEADVVFSCLPHGASSGFVAELAAKGKPVIDLSADFRLSDAEVYKKWYGEHSAPELLKEAVYGLPELNRKAIKTARIIANPGCYPTAAILSLAPLAKAGLLAGDVIIDAKSGVSGAGRSASLDTSFVEVTNSMKAYKVGCHRHTPEIAQGLATLAGTEIKTTFTPHLIPISRGILSTAYARLSKTISSGELRALYTELYAKEPFVRVLADGDFPEIRNVRCSNYADIGLHIDDSGLVTVVSAIDNLVKGASGQAIQNMNILFGITETTGLTALPTEI